ncbi:DMT family transporter [Phytoactinopolyspora limicola]|uniref:DMT family transporter n=1 Tax=Phytoactinopolyspora limicola TaxID=2715536 RepID=UPI001A9C5437|nr:EamA family transporter [Phytoactinopolyspora limicola]
MDNFRFVDVSTPSIRRAGLWAVGAAGLFWGTGGLAGALLAERTGAGALAVAGYRLLVGGALVITLLALRGQLYTGRREHSERPARPGYPALPGDAGDPCEPRQGVSTTYTRRRRVIVIALLAVVFQSCYFGAVELMSVSLATLVTLGSAPILVIVGESLLARCWPVRRLMAAVAVALVGLVLLVGGPNAGASGAVVAGTVCAVVSGAGFAGITMLAARPVPGLRTLPLTGLAFGLGGLLLLPVAAVASDLGSLNVDAGTVGLVVYLGLVPTALAYALYFGGLRTVAPGTAALVALLEPLTAAGLGALVLGDQLGVAGVVGAVLVAAAMGLAATSRPSP